MTHSLAVTTQSPSAGAGISRTDKRGAPFQVRPFRTDDRAALEAFYEVFEPKRAAQGLPPLGRERVARWLDTVLTGGEHLLAFRAGTLIGHAFLLPTGQEGVAEYAVFLCQEERGQGVGTELNRTAVELARAQGWARLWLTVEPHNRAAIRSYEKAGFRFLPATVFSPEAEMALDL